MGAPLPLPSNIPGPLAFCHTSVRTETAPDRQLQCLCFSRDSSLQVFSLAALSGRSLKCIPCEAGVDFWIISATDFRFQKLKYCTETFNAPGYVCTVAFVRDMP
jgi:hypothetical protein